MSHSRGQSIQLWDYRDSQTTQHQTKQLLQKSIKAPTQTRRTENNYTNAGTWEKKAIIKAEKSELIKDENDLDNEEDTGLVEETAWILQLI